VGAVPRSDKMVPAEHQRPPDSTGGEVPGVGGSPALKAGQERRAGVEPAAQRGVNPGFPRYAITDIRAAS
jgi:hypothetical protein